MLVLSRKRGQSLNIGDNVRVVVLDVAGDTVRIGIEAPPEVPFTAARSTRPSGRRTGRRWLPGKQC